MPTPYPDLNAVLADLVSSVREILGENFVGAYLQGSFAVGDADEHSDVDFLVVTHDEVGDAEAKLQALHQRLFELPTHWAQHLEGSYVPKEQLRRLGPERPPDPWTRVYQPTDADLAARTLAFVDYAMDVLATKYGGTRSAAR